MANKPNPGQFGSEHRPDTQALASLGGRMSGGKIKDSATARAMGKRGAEVRNRNRKAKKAQ